MHRCFNTKNVILQFCGSKTAEISCIEVTKRRCPAKIKREGPP